jgi:hypothetical protein
MTKVESDSVLIKMIARGYYEILRRILFSNRIHLIHLPDHLKIQERASATDQFLAVISSPERVDIQTEEGPVRRILHLAQITGEVMAVHLAERTRDAVTWTHNFKLWELLSRLLSAKPIRRAYDARFSARWYAAGAVRKRW